MRRAHQLPQLGAKRHAAAHAVAQVQARGVVRRHGRVRRRVGRRVLRTGLGRGRLRRHIRRGVYYRGLGAAVGDAGGEARGTLPRARPRGRRRRAFLAAAARCCRAATAGHHATAATSTAASASASAGASAGRRGCEPAHDLGHGALPLDDGANPLEAPPLQPLAADLLHRLAHLGVEPQQVVEAVLTEAVHVAEGHRAYGGLARSALEQQRHLAKVGALLLAVQPQLAALEGAEDLDRARLHEEHLQPELALAEDVVARRGEAWLEQLAHRRDKSGVLPAEEVDVHDGAGVEEHEHLVAQGRAELGEDAPLGHRVGAGGEVVVVVVLRLLDELRRDVPLAQRRLDDVHPLLRAVGDGIEL
mmetsp:Transcript_60680/g.146023  ORF Transcript_60680/g.146023 Transcript_60680/m.146023 type:complete len:361 (-) Transcript_60680:3811-4893(-)